METQFARALYDNIAETVDELAFHKGDIIIVLEKNVVGSTGWWKCCLHDRQGLAPANRLAPLSLVEAEKLCIKLAAERDNLQNHGQQSIYQIPKATLAPVSAIYEEMKTVHSVPLQTASPDKHRAQADPEETRSPHEALPAHPRTGTEIYDVPSLVRKPSFFAPSSVYPLETSLTSGIEVHNRYELLSNMRCAMGLNKKVATVSPMVPQDPNYDIPIPSISEDIQKPPCGYSTMPKPCNSEWIYDVPVFPQKQGCELVAHCGTVPPKTKNSNMPLYDTLPTHFGPVRKHSPPQPLYDIPKPSNAVAQSAPVPGNSINSSIYDVPPCVKQTETTVVPARQQSPPETESKIIQEPLEYRDKPGPLYEQLQRWPSRSRMMYRPVEGAIGRDDQGKKDHQRSSTVSTSSTASSSSRSSCDSFMLSSPEPEPFREVTISQEEAANRLLELQEEVCQSVPKLMLFVSSQWRSKEHLGEHLHRIRTAAEDVTDSVTCFMNFALDIRGNAQRLTDVNLQTRLLKQVSIVEDSGVILQQAASALRDLGWLLDSLAQDAGQSQTPDHLERFVMVARTVPEDVRRLVSIINANGKLLFRVMAKEPDVVESIDSSEGRRHSQSEPLVDSGVDESDYVQIQQSKEVDQQPKPAKSSFKTKRNGDSLKKQTSISDHCRLYFGALQKAISVFTSSLNDRQPPEQFISHSKLVIMVGQRLINSLCSEAKSRKGDQGMLSMSNQLCAHLKQLALVTKKAALNFPDIPALQEAQDVAKELAQMAQHFRMSVDV